LTQSLEQIEKIENTPNEIRDMAAFLYELIESQITRADTKAGLIIAAATVFAAGLIIFSKGALPNVFNAALPTSERLTGLFIVLTYVALAISVTFALLTARPIMRAHTNDRSMFFFGNISRMAYPDFLEQFSRQSNQQLYDALMVQVHTTARLAHQKFLLIRYSLDFLIVAVFLWTLVQLMIALGN
jgi:hypothetical protein